MPSPIGHLLASLAVALVATPEEDSARTASDSWPTAERCSADGLVPPTRTVEPSAPSPQRVKRGSRWASSVLAIAAVGLVPDIDLLVGRHSGAWHSVGAASLVGLVAALLPTRHRVRIAVAVGLAYLSHPLLDWLSEDSSWPFGIMALWPFSAGYYHSGLDWFGATDRRYWLDGFWWRNLRSVAREVCLLGPVTLLTWRVRAHFRASRFDPRGEAHTS